VRRTLQGVRAVALLPRTWLVGSRPLPSAERERPGRSWSGIQRGPRSLPRAATRHRGSVGRPVRAGAGAAQTQLRRGTAAPSGGPAAGRRLGALGGPANGQRGQTAVSSLVFGWRTLMLDLADQPVSPATLTGQAPSRQAGPTLTELGSDTIQQLRSELAARPIRVPLLVVPVSPMGTPDWDKRGLAARAEVLTNGEIVLEWEAEEPSTTSLLVLTRESD